MEPERIDPEEIHQKVQAGRAILLCAYEAEERLRKVQLKGAISLNEFKSRLTSLPRDQEIIFYSA